MARVPEGVFPRFLTDRGLDIRQPTIENQAHQVAKDVANYLASGGTIAATGTVFVDVSGIDLDRDIIIAGASIDFFNFGQG